MTVPYEDIRKYTQNFSDSYKLGSGSFGTVYFMIMQDTKFAIKRLHQVSIKGVWSIFAKWSLRNLRLKKKWAKLFNCM